MGWLEAGLHVWKRASIRILTDPGRGTPSRACRYQQKVLREGIEEVLLELALG